MNLRAAASSVIVVCLSAVVLSTPQESSGEPILKPRKYHGPIPKRCFTFDIGVLGGADNEEMWDYLDRQVDDPLKKRTETKDFGASLSLDASYTVKLHPQFAFRTRAGFALLRSESRGFDVPIVETPTDTLPLLRFERGFDVLLFSIDGTALFYFQDAAVKEFQTYVGGGFSVYFPYSKFTEDLTDDETGRPWAAKETSDWSVQPGIHAVGGFLYLFARTVAVNIEGRLQIVQSKFTLNYRTTSGERPLNFDSDYTGFIVSAGVTKFF